MVGRVRRDPDGLNFEVRLATVASCTPVQPEGCSGRTSPDFLPTISAATTGSSVATTPVLLRLPSGRGSVPGFVVGTQSFSPFGSGVTGNVTVNFWYFGRPIPRVDGGAPRTIEIDLRSVLADA